jgi:hypothetical protein
MRNKRERWRRERLAGRPKIEGGCIYKASPVLELGGAVDKLAPAPGSQPPMISRPDKE